MFGPTAISTNIAFYDSRYFIFSSRRQAASKWESNGSSTGWSMDFPLLGDSLPTTKVKRCFNWLKQRRGVVWGCSRWGVLSPAQCPRHSDCDYERRSIRDVIEECNLAPRNLGLRLVPGEMRLCLVLLRMNGINMPDPLSELSGGVFRQFSPSHPP